MNLPSYYWWYTLIWFSSLLCCLFLPNHFKHICLISWLQKHVCHNYCQLIVLLTFDPLLIVCLLCQWLRNLDPIYCCSHFKFLCFWIFTTNTPPPCMDLVTLLYVSITVLWVYFYFLQRSFLNPTVSLRDYFHK